MIDSPAKCEKCGATLHAPTTGKVLNVCYSCGGAMRTIRLLHLEKAPSFDTGVMGELLSKHMTECLDDEGRVKLVEKLIHTVIVRENKLVTLERELARAKIENARLQLEIDASCNAEELQQVRAALAEAQKDKERLEKDIGAVSFDYDQLRDTLAVAEEALNWWQALKKESRGVAGYHMNGDIAEWDELDDPTAEALAGLAALKPKSP